MRLALLGLIAAGAVDDEVSNELVVDEDDDVVAGAEHRCRPGCVAVVEADEVSNSWAR